MAAKCNVPSRTLFIGDNLDILRGINSECIDLIYLDPPFNAGRRYSARSTSEARGVTFDDTWSLDDMKPEWMDEIEVRRPALYHVINAFRLAHGESMAGYLAFMAVLAYSNSDVSYAAPAASTCIAIHMPPTISKPQWTPCSRPRTSRTR